MDNVVLSPTAKRICALFGGGDKTFIELGTWYGESTAEFAKHFREVHTVELVPEVYKAACENLKEWKNIKLYLGNSVDVLPELLEENPGSVVFLDAHLQPEHKSQFPAYIPILEEIDIVSKYDVSVLIVDDIWKLVNEHGLPVWPKLKQNGWVEIEFDHASGTDFIALRKAI